MGFSRQEHWSGLPFPSPGDLPEPGNEPGSPALKADSLLGELPGKPYQSVTTHCTVCHLMSVSRAVRTLLFARIILPGLTLPSPSFLFSFCKAITWITGDWWSQGGRIRKIWSNHLLTSFLSKFRVRVPELHSGETDSCSSRSSYQEI